MNKILFISEYNICLVANVGIISQIFTLDFLVFLFVVIAQTIIFVFVRLIFSRLERKMRSKKYLKERKKYVTK